MKIKLESLRKLGTRKLVITAFAMLLFAAGTFGQTDTRLAATWQVVKYDIVATLPAQDVSRDVSIRATLDLQNVSGRPAPSLTLRVSPNATISNVTLNGSTADVASSEEKLGSVSLQRIALRVPAIPAGGSLKAVIDYKYSVKENTGTSTLAPNGTHFLPVSYWYPTPNSWYFARGADYAPTRIEVKSASGAKVVSSGSESSNAFDQALFVQPFFLTGTWEIMNHNGVSVYLPGASGEVEKRRAAELADIANEAKAHFASILGTSPSTPMRIVSAFRGSGFSSGGTLLVDRAAFSRTKVDSVTAFAITEMVAKLWVGDAVRLSGDGYGVIREGFPRFLADQFIEKKYGKDIADMERTRQRIAYSAISRRDAPLNLVAPLDDYYFAAVANKGAMVWRILAGRVGEAELVRIFKENSRGGTLILDELRKAMSREKDLLDNLLDKTTEMNLLVGLPQARSGETVVALRNTGSIDVTVNVVAHLENGQKIVSPTTIKNSGFGELIFRTPAKVVRVEIDPEKLYPQTDYSDDIAPRDTTDSDLVLAVKRDFDRQAFGDAEKTARTIIKWNPRFEDVRVLLGRSLLAQNKLLEAEQEFNAVIAEKLPTPRALAWAYVGLADVASRTGRTDDALRLSQQAILADAEYGAGLAARAIRNKLNRATAIDEAIKAYFVQFDRAAISNRKTELDALILPGEIARFAAGITGQAVEWRSDVRYVDRLDADVLLVEANLNVRLLNREPESGMAVFRLIRTPNGLKMIGVDIFEVR